MQVVWVKIGDFRQITGYISKTVQDNFDLFRTFRTSSFCTVAWQLARFQLTRRIARSLGDSWASCTDSGSISCLTWTEFFWRLFLVCFVIKLSNSGPAIWSTFIRTYICCRTFRLWTMLKQLLNANNGLLLILTLNNTDLSLLSVSVIVKKWECTFSVKIKVLNFKVKFSGHF